MGNKCCSTNPRQQQAQLQPDFVGDDRMYDKPKILIGQMSPFEQQLASIEEEIGKPQEARETTMISTTPETPERIEQREPGPQAQPAERVTFGQIDVPDQRISLRDSQVTEEVKDESQCRSWISQNSRTDSMDASSAGCGQQEELKGSQAASEEMEPEVQYVGNRALTCQSFHKMQFFPGGFKRVKAPETGVAQADKRTVLKCQNCSESINRELREGFSSCLHDCDQYLCRRCSQCPGCKKLFAVSFSNPEDFHSVYLPWGTCFVCNKSFMYPDHRTTKKAAFLCCLRCTGPQKYRVCQNCIKPAFFAPT